MIEKLHIEPTSRCTLECPRCERTILIDKFQKKRFNIKDIDVEALTNFLDMPLDHVDLCGNLGDPIYHKDFLHLVAEIKKKANSVSIFTNGSYKNAEWWQQLCKILDDRDTIVFAIDGTPDNFTKYRVNADWQSIEQGIKVCTSSSIKTEWKYIVFSYNQNDIEYCRKLAEDYGFDYFYVEYSERWETDNDDLKPLTNNLIGVKSQLKEEYNVQGHSETLIDPRCSTAQHYISATGLYTPCCWSSDHRFYYKSEWYKQKNRFDIKNTALSSCVEYFEEFYKRIHTTRPDYCVFNCGKCE